MCRNIKPLFNFEPPATGNEMHDAALQFVRKISGFPRPSQANEAAFQDAVEEIERSVRKLLRALDTSAPPKTARSLPPRRANGRGSASSAPAEL